MLGSLRDICEGASSLRDMRDNIIAHDKVLYHGHPVAAVAALALLRDKDTPQS